MAMMAELSHLEEIIGQLDKHTADPFSLPSSTEQVRSRRMDLLCFFLILLFHPDDCRTEGHDGPKSLGFTNSAQQPEFARFAQVFHVQSGLYPQLIQRKRRFSFPSMCLCHMSRTEGSGRAGIVDIVMTRVKTHNDGRWVCLFINSRTS